MDLNLDQIQVKSKSNGIAHLIYPQFGRFDSKRTLYFMHAFYPSTALGGVALKRIVPVEVQIAECQIRCLIQRYSNPDLFSTWALTVIGALLPVVVIYSPAAIQA